jgi:hypothetical protein
MLRLICPAYTLNFLGSSLLRPNVPEIILIYKPVIATIFTRPPLKVQQSGIAWTSIDASDYCKIFWNPYNLFLWLTRVAVGYTIGRKSR